MVEANLPLPLGTLIDDKFRVTKEIGRGGMAAVFEAENVDIGKRVAVKVLSKELSHSKVVTERFIREARAAAKIRSPYICDVFDVGTYDGLPFLVMELLEGESLYERLARERRLSVEDTLRIVDQISRGLQKAHEQGIVHRDLKPENIFLTVGEDGLTLSKIVDFGLAKFYEPNAEGGAQARITKEGALFGTPAYMSPEQARARGEVDQRADLWALACIVYEMLVGTTVWNVDQGVAMILAQIASAPLPRPSRLRDDLPRSFDHWFERALDRNIEQRFQSAKELWEALKESFAPEVKSRSSSVSSEAEGLQVDELVASDSSPGLRPSPAGAVLPPPDPAAAADAGRGSPGALPVSASTVPPKPRSRWGLITVLLLLGGSLAGSAVWGASHPDELRELVARARKAVHDLTGSNDSKLPSTQGPASSPVREPQERAPYALQLNEAQEALRSGNAQKAKALMEASFNMGKDKAARSLLTQLATALASDPGACTLTALGHPRPFDASSDSSIPSVRVTTAGVVVVWADSHEQKERRQAFTTLLDPALRRVSEVINVTPESRSVQTPQLALAGGKLALLYWETGEQPGVYVRALEEDGRMAAAPQLLSSSTPGMAYNPAFAADPDGTFWAVWSEMAGPKNAELTAQHLGADLKPIGDKVQLTAHPPAAGQALASVPALWVDDERLNVAFRVQRSNQFDLLLLRARPRGPDFARGVEPFATPDPSAKGASSDVEQARYLGDILQISQDATKHSVPQLSCTAEGCFVGWDAEKVGGQLGFVRHADGELVWYKEIDAKSSRPSVASQGDQTVACWYEDGRVKLGKVSADGIAAGSVVARGSGFHPSTEVRPGRMDSDNAPTHWYIAWRDYEGGEHEPFVARVDCKR